MRGEDLLAYIVCLLALGFAFGFMAGGSDASEAIPTCTEDSVLVGTGNFESGRWSDYVCGPAVDDYMGA